MDMMFSIGADPKLYNEDLGQLQLQLNLRSWQLLQLQWDCYEAVARIRLVKTEDINVCVAIALYYL
jgi:hypothetical protein